MSPERFHALIRGETRGVGAALARAGLWWTRLPYGAGAWARNRLFELGIRKSSRVAVPVVSIGNLTLGGTGKTPCVEYVASFYRGLGLAVALLSRGYGSSTGHNDEALVLEENLPDVPHLQGANRVALAQTAVEELESEVLVLDDGFQHRRLARDLDVVLIDATRPLSREYLFPRGLLREPVRELKRAGLVILTRTDQVEPETLNEQTRWLATKFPRIPIATSVHEPVALTGVDGSRGVDDLKGRTVGAFCGIGNPAAFLRTLTDLGATVAAFREFPDHHPYTRADVEHLQSWAVTLPPGAEVVTTQKDHVKLRLPELANRRLWALRIGMRFTSGEAEIQTKLSHVVKRMTNDN